MAECTEEPQDYSFPKQPLPDRIHALIFEFAYYGESKEATPLLLWLLQLAWKIEGKEPLPDETMPADEAKRLAAGSRLPARS